MPSEAGTQGGRSQPRKVPLQPPSGPVGRTEGGHDEDMSWLAPAEWGISVERMTTLDAGFYFVEHDNVPMHIGSLAIFEGPAPGYED